MSSRLIIAALSRATGAPFPSVPRGTASDSTFALSKVSATQAFLWIVGLREKTLRKIHSLLELQHARLQSVHFSELGVEVLHVCLERGVGMPFALETTAERPHNRPENDYRG